MRLRSTLLAGALALAGLIGSATKADAQVITYGYASPYYGMTYPYMSAYTTPYTYGVSPYLGSPYYGMGYTSPYWVGRAYNYYSPLWGNTYYRGVYANPGYGPGVYSYRYWRGW